MKELNPLDQFQKTLDNWWIIAVCMVIGAMIAYGFHLARPPIYEATATIMATIDTYTFPFQGVREDLIQYNEDMALGTIEGVLRSAEVTQTLITTASSAGIQITAADLKERSTIERKHAIWELRFRSSDPQNAQSIVNYWMEIGYTAMLTWQADGRIPSYVILESPTYAYLPTTPITYQLNKLLLAGLVIGSTVGVLLSMILPYNFNQSKFR
jgi:uncharacterized protein involved in exopolysaccharide biosynthesis